MGGSPYLDIVLFAMVAVFIALRLRSVLGRRTGAERPPPSFGQPDAPFNAGFARRPSADARGAGPIIDVTPTPANDVAGGDALARIRGYDPSVAPDSFLAGARAAFEMVLAAFARGDEAALRPLLAPDVFDNFAQAIRARVLAGEICENKLVKLLAAEIADAELAGTEGRITVKFASQQIVAVKDAKGAVVEGDPAKIVEVTDLWTFARDLRAHDPNWTLVATRSQDE